MKKTIFIVITILLSFLSVVVCAQDKTQAYYAQHEREILPDAQTEFTKGNYQRAVLLCQWHYVMVGDDAASSLRDKAEKCQTLLEEMNRLYLEGDNEAAIEKAMELLALNPEDAIAKELLLATKSSLTEPIEEETIITPEYVTIEDTLVYVDPNVVSDPELDLKPEQLPSEIIETPQPVPLVPVQSTMSIDAKHKTRIGIKASLSTIDLKNKAIPLAYGGSIVAYDIVGSRFGGEFGVIYSSSLPNSSSFYEYEMSVLLRVVDNLYPKIIAGFFNCKNSSGNSSTTGMNAGVGLSIVSRHYCIDFGIKYNPIIYVHSSETEYIAGIETVFSSSSLVLSEGIIPYVSIGLVF
ncbi:MAG: hypothetical protein J5490_02600 [Bacteroidales bacterium]|nr:hypothetical protein [Bacteroidales bacterium]